MPGRAEGDFALACRSNVVSPYLPTALERVAWFDDVASQWVAWEVGEWTTSNLADRAWDKLSEEEQAAAIAQGRVTDGVLSEAEQASVWNDTLTAAEIG